MARKGFTECPVCGCDVSVEKLSRHLRKVHPKEAAEHGARKVKKGKAKKRSRGLSEKRRELLKVRKRKDTQTTALIIAVISVVIVALFLLWHYWAVIFPEKGNPVIVMETSEGTITFEIYEDKVPVTAKNFNKYVKAGFYEGLIFHRVANLDASNPDSAIIQSGGFKPGMVRKDPLYSEIPLETHKTLTHDDGAVAMARTDDPDSASSQFYMCDGPHHFLDDAERQAGGQGRGYSVFGKVLSGMDVMRAISGAEVTTESGYQNVPVEDITIEKMYIE